MERNWGPGNPYWPGTTHKTTHENRLRGAVIGALIGDALGVPYEFRPSSAIPPYAAIEMAPPEGFSRAWGGIEPGTWSDDGALLLCVLSTLLGAGMDVYDLARQFRLWARTGYLAVDGHVFDIGGTTSAGISRLERGIEPRRAGATNEGSRGNGSLMRVLPVALYPWRGPEKMDQFAREQSRLTHGHPFCLDACMVYCRWVRAILDSGERVNFDSIDWQAGVSAGFVEALTEKRRAPRGTGEVVDTLATVIDVINRARSYEQAVRFAVQFGNDTDTTACIAGGVAGAMWGLDSIPNRWQGQLRGRGLCDPLVNGLIRAWRF